MKRLSKMYHNKLLATCSASLDAFASLSSQSEAHFIDESVTCLLTIYFQMFFRIIFLPLCKHLLSTLQSLYMFANMGPMSSIFEESEENALLAVRRLACVEVDLRR